MNIVHYNVSGLFNEHVKTQLKNVLSDINGVSMISVDLLKSSIEVGYNDAVDARKIIEGIERVGCKID